MIKHVSCVLAVSLVSVGLAAGCSSSSKSAASSSAPQSTSGSSTASSSGGAGASSPSAAGQQYLGLTAQPSADLVAFLALPNTAQIAQARAAAAKFATDETALLHGLKQAQWPASVQADITTLESEVAKEQPIFQHAAAAPSIAAIKSILQQNQATILARGTAANQVRQALGLPARITRDGRPQSSERQRR